jgi:hypothetical protein
MPVTILRHTVTLNFTTLAGLPMSGFAPAAENTHGQKPKHPDIGVFIPCAREYN